jgi:hypothetical protein
VRWEWNYAVQCQYDIRRQNYEIWIHRRSGTNFDILTHDDSGQEIHVPIEQGEDASHVKPFLTIPEYLAADIVAALTGQGLKPKELSKVEGVLEATQRHLVDLQGILRLKKILP